jgi:hypothetical protein
MKIIRYSIILLMVMKQLMKQQFLEIYTYLQVQVVHHLELIVYHLFLMVNMLDQIMEYLCRK